MSSTRVLLALTAAVLPALVTGCAGSTSDGEAGSDVVGVSVQIARQQTLRATANASGVIVPATAGDWTVTAFEPGDIAELPKAVGDAVVIGDILVRFAVPAVAQDVAARELAVSEAISRLDRARGEAARQQSLFDRGLTARNVWDAARIAETAAETSLTQAQADLAASKAAEGRTIVRARFPGVVESVTRAVGDAVRPDDAVLRVVDPTRLQVAVQLPVAQLARVFPGQAAVVRAIAGASDESATVTFKSETHDPSVATGEVRLAFVTPTTLPMNTPVSAEILLDQRTDAIVVPSAAVLRDEMSPFVMIAGDDRRALRRDVRVGLVAGDLTQITAGVAAGERVIVTGAADVAEGTPIAFEN